MFFFVFFLNLLINFFLKIFLWAFLDLIWIFWILFKVTKVTSTEHQKGPNITALTALFWPKGKIKASTEGWSQPQELEVSPRSRLYLLVCYKRKIIGAKNIYLPFGPAKSNPILAIVCHVIDASAIF